MEARVLTLSIAAETEADLAEVANIFARQLVGFGLRGLDGSISMTLLDEEEDI